MTNLKTIARCCHDSSIELKSFYAPISLLNGTIYRAASPAKLVQQVLAMKPEEQLQVFNMLKDSLTKRGLLAIQ